jgi:hypothetical protein
MDRRIVLQLVGETMREMGMLTGVFIPLDWAFSGRPINTHVLFAFSAASVVLIACGILLEAKNRWTHS